MSAALTPEPTLAEASETIAKKSELDTMEQVVRGFCSIPPSSVDIYRAAITPAT